MFSHLSAGPSGSLQSRSLTTPRWLLPTLLVAVFLSVLIVWQPITPGDIGERGVAPLVFVPNGGPTAAEAPYHALGAGGTLSFLNNGVRFDLSAVGAEGIETAVQLTFAGAASDTGLTAGPVLDTRVNRYAGSDPAQWQQDLPAYGAITYQGLYPGIDLLYEGQGGLLKGTFTVAPGADPALIAWGYSGVEDIAIDSDTGALHLTLPDGSRLIEEAPVAWQESGGRQTAVPVAYALAGGQISFELGAYDATLPLTIDPTIIYETIYNAGNLDSGQDIVVDAAGNAYVAGYVYPDFFVIKLDPAGNFDQITFVSGSNLDYSTDLAYYSGSVYATGRTLSSDFPILNAIQPTKNGNADAFLVKLNAADLTLAQSTYFGGSRGEEGGGITLDGAGNIYLSGATDSTDFYTVDAIQDQLNLTNCFCEDAFVSKLTPDGLTILFSTYLGGGFTDFGHTIALDAAGNIYFAGTTDSDDFPLQNPVQATYGGGENDTFVARISLGPSTLDYSTYLGGSDYDWQRGLVVDDAGYAYVAGATRSPNFPTTAGAFQTSFAGAVNGCGSPPFGVYNCEDLFLSKLTPDGSAFAYSTYIGGTKDDFGNGIALDSNGLPYVVGYTYSTDYPGGDGTFGFILVSILSQDGSQLLQTTVLDSATPGAGHGIAIDAGDNYYVTGAANAPADVYVVKFAAENVPLADLAVDIDASAQQITLGAPVTYTIAITNAGPLTATGALLTVDLPAELAFDSAGSSQGSCSHASGEVSCTLGDLLPGSAATITVVATGQQAGTAVVTATGSSDLTDPDMANNSAEATITVTDPSIQHQIFMPVIMTGP